MSSELPAVSGTAANQVKFADSVYFDHPEYHRMMAVWRARDRAEAQADARHLSGDARVSFVEKEVTYFETTQDPTRAETIADSDAAALLKDVGIKFNVVDKFLREVDKFGTTHTPDHRLALKYHTGEEIFEAAQNPRNPKHEVAWKLLTSYLNWNASLPFISQPGIRAALEHIEIVDGNRETQASLKRLLDGVKLSTAEEDRLMRRVKSVLEATLEEDSEKLKKLKEIAEKRRQSIESEGRNSVYWNDASDAEKAEFYGERFNRFGKAMGAMAGIARLAGDSETANKINQAIAIPKTRGSNTSRSVSREEPGPTGSITRSWRAP